MRLRDNRPLAIMAPPRRRILILIVATLSSRSSRDMHTLPDGFHRIRHCGFLANSHRADKLAVCRLLLDLPQAAAEPAQDTVPPRQPERCPRCGGVIIMLAILPQPASPRPSFRNDTS